MSTRARGPPVLRLAGLWHRSYFPRASHPLLESSKMSESRWHFRRFQPGDNLSDPDFTKALFASDSDAAVARSLVREAIQNSLDARASETEVVRVRIAVHRNESAADPLAAAPFVLGLQPHLDATDAGLADAPKSNKRIPFLVLEDFGTRGLCGDSEHWRPVDIGKNAFFLFFRALGRSGKADEARGRWGVGKFVFPMSSAAHAIWGLTVPIDTGEPLLMGRAVLRTHTADGHQWHPDGHWGDRLVEGSNMVSPSRNPSLLQRFRETFRVSRTSEPGLSVVVPWLTDEIQLDGLREAVLAEYFLPLLRGQLVLEVQDDAQHELIDASTVRAYAKTSTDRVLRERLAVAVAVVDATGLALEWPVSLPWDSLTIRREDLPSALRDTLITALDAGRVISVSLPVTVGTKQPPSPRRGTLVVHLRRAEGMGGLRPLIIRDGITVSQDRTKQTYDHAALLVAERCALATAIGDAETPAHEQLQHDLLRERYKYPRKLVGFVREAASALLRAIRHGESEDDPFTLANFFPVEAEEGPQKPTPTTRKSGPKPDAPIPPIPPGRPRRFRVAQVERGFRLTGNPNAERAPVELKVLLAYDVRRGDPIRRYRPFDFDVGSKEIAKAAEGCTIAATEGNSITVRPVAPDFSLSVTGFDPQRDLIVRVTASDSEEQP
jgi:hypothetical protein